MRQLPFKRLHARTFLLCILLVSSTCYAQLNWSKDTISRADALAGKLNYLNNIRGGGNSNATEQINLPVDKMKQIMDACEANNIPNISVFFIKIRAADVAHYKQLNPSASDDDIKGSQMLVIRVPRSAFAGKMSSKVDLSTNNPLVVSLLAAGLILVDYPWTGLPPGTGDVFVTVGTICPPPASCD